MLEVGYSPRGKRKDLRVQAVLHQECVEQGYDDDDGGGGGGESCCCCFDRMGNQAKLAHLLQGVASWRTKHPRLQGIQENVPWGRQSMKKGVSDK